MRTFLILFPGLLLGLLPGCHKRTVVIPTACMTVSKTTCHVGDTLTVRNCSEADIVYVLFADPTLPDPANCKCELSADQFDADNLKHYRCLVAGEHHVFIKAINNQSGAPVKTQQVTITVLP